MLNHRPFNKLLKDKDLLTRILYHQHRATELLHKMERDEKLKNTNNNTKPVVDSK